MTTDLLPAAQTIVTDAVNQSLAVAAHAPTGLAELDLDPAHLFIGDVVKGVVGIAGCDARSGAKGGFFLYEFRTRAGRIRAVAWSEVAPKCAPFPQHSVVWIEAKVTAAYNNPDGRELQVIDMRAAEGSMNFWSMALPAFPEGPDTLWARFHDLVNRMDEPWQPAFLESVFAVVSKEAFATCPAARGIGHQAYFHGLLEHSVEVAEVAHSTTQLPANASKVKAGFTVLGALLHDVGKVREYIFDGTGEFALSMEGRMKHHTAIGSEIFAEAFAAHRELLVGLGMTKMHLLHLQHVAVSHHGRAEWGSVTEPLSIEAQIIHLADGMSAHVASMRDAIGNASFDAAGFSTGKVPFHKAGVFDTMRGDAAALASPLPLFDSPTV